MQEDIAPQRSTMSRLKKTEFCLTEEMSGIIKLQETVTISQFVEHLNELRDEKRMKRLAAVHLTAKLKEAGYLEEQFNHLLGRNMTLPTEKGINLGISTEKRSSEKGNEYEIVIYNEEAQGFLLSLLPKE